MKVKSESETTQSYPTLSEPTDCSLPRSSIHWNGLPLPSLLYYELLPKNKTIHSKNYCSQLDQLRAILDKKYLELVNSKCIIFHQDNTRPHVL